jgi:hypothetical protein
MSHDALLYNQRTHYLKATLRRYLKAIDSNEDTDAEIELSLDYNGLINDLFRRGFRKNKTRLDKANALFRSLVFSPILIQTKLIDSDASLLAASRALWELLNTHNQVDEGACDALAEWILEYLEVPAHWCEPSWMRALACFNVVSEHTCKWTKLQAACTVGCGIGVLFQLLDVHDSAQFERYVRLLFSGFALGEVILRYVREEAVMGESERMIKQVIYALASGEAYLSWIQPYMRQSNRLDHTALVLSHFNSTDNEDASRAMTLPLSQLAHMLLMMFALYDVSQRVSTRVNQLRLAFLALIVALPLHHVRTVGPEALESAHNLSHLEGDALRFHPVLMNGGRPSGDAATLYAVTDVAFLLATSTMASTRRLFRWPQALQDAAGAWRYALTCPGPARVIAALEKDMARNSDVWSTLFPAVKTELNAERHLWPKVEHLRHFIEPSIRAAERSLCAGVRRNHEVLQWTASQSRDTEYGPFIHRFEAKLAQWLKNRLGVEQHPRDFVTRFHLYDGSRTGEVQYARDAYQNSSSFDDWTQVDPKNLIEREVNVVTRDHEPQRYLLRGAPPTELWAERPPANNLVHTVTEFGHNAVEPIADGLTYVTQQVQGAARRAMGYIFSANDARMAQQYSENAHEPNHTNNKNGSGANEFAEPLLENDMHHETEADNPAAHINNAEPPLHRDEVRAQSVFKLDGSAYRGGPLTPPQYYYSVRRPPSSSSPPPLHRDEVNAQDAFKVDGSAYGGSAFAPPRYSVLHPLYPPPPHEDNPSAHQGPLPPPPHEDNSRAYQGPLPPPRSFPIFRFSPPPPPIVNYSHAHVMDWTRPEYAPPEPPAPLPPPQHVNAVRKANRQSYSNTTPADTLPSDDPTPALYRRRGAVAVPESHYKMSTAEAVMSTAAIMALSALKASGSSAY